jgi:hypothetical protein
MMINTSFRILLAFPVNANWATAATAPGPYHW